MRGNENRSVIDDWAEDLHRFTIPMRGNEMASLADSAGATAFTIPMRGNEVPDSPDDLNSWSRSTVYDPHEG